MLRLPWYQMGVTFCVCHVCACRDPAKGALPNVALMQRIPPASSIVAYFDFVFKVGWGNTHAPWTPPMHVSCCNRPGLQYQFECRQAAGC